MKRKEMLGPSIRPSNSGRHTICVLVPYRCLLLPKRQRLDGACMSFSTKKYINSGGFTIGVNVLIGCPLLPKRLHLQGASKVLGHRKK